MASPAELLPLLVCPLCAQTLSNPTTLLCGHALCSHHLDAPSPSCPVAACADAPAPPARPRIPPDSRVVFTAAPVPVPAPHDVPALTDHRSDVTLNKVCALVTRTQAALSPPDDDDEPDYPSSSARPPHRRDSSHRPRKRHKRSHSDDGSDDDEPDLLSHLQSAAARARLVPPDTPLLPSVPRSSGPLPQPPTDASILADFDKKLLEELTCHICYVLFYQPVTTPCQHTFCAKCLQRSLDHSTTCPICRHDLPSYFFQDQPVNKTIMSIILKAYPLLYQERRDAIAEEERHARLNTPIFVLNLTFPGIPTFLHFYEPRYRLMLRRCLESPHPRFGMIMSPKSGAPQTDYGVMLEIRSVQMLPDGRSMVETWGSTRFRILERGTLDGYMVGRVEKIEDYEDDLEEEPRLPTDAELMATCRSFLDRLQRGAAPWVVQRLSQTYGAIPSDPAQFAFWVALVLPIEEHEKAKLLPIRSARLRLVLVVHWIEQLNNHWWFANGCTIL